MTNADLDQQILDQEARQGERMLESVYRFLGRYVAYPSDHARVAHALWVVHTHAMDIWASTPRICFLSAEPGSGKTRALEISELLTPNPILTFNISPSALFRMIGNAESPPTILFDEVDAIFGPKAKENEDLRTLLNVGHRRSARVHRCVPQGNSFTTEAFPAYAAVAMAGLGSLPDTILSRSVIVRMRRRHTGERVEPFRERTCRPEGAAVLVLIEHWLTEHDVDKQHRKQGH